MSSSTPAPGRRPRFRVHWLVPVLLAAAVAATLALVMLPDRVVVHAGLLIDGTGDPPRENVTIVIRDGIISDIVPRGSVGWLPARRVIDAGDAVVVPGFVIPSARALYSSADGGRVWTREGVTTIVDLGSSLERIRHLRHAYSEPHSPRLLVSGPAVALFKSYPHWHWPDEFAVYVSGRGEAETVIPAHLAEANPDVLFMSTRRGPARLTGPLMQTITEIAHAHGKKAIVEVDDAASFIQAVNAGVDVIDYEPYQSNTAATLQRAADKGIMILVTVQTARFIRRFPAYTHAMSTVREFHRLGGRLAFPAGRTDIRPGIPLEDMKVYHRYGGMSEMDLIVALTRNGAMAAGACDRIGTVQPGRYGDLVILEGNPLDRLDHLSDIRLVLKSGRIVHRAEGGP